MIDPAFRAALDRLRAASAAAGVEGRWAITAGAAMVLHGLEAGPPRDIDVSTDAQAALALIAALGAAPAPRAPAARWRSAVFARIGADPALEIMGDFEALGPHSWGRVHPRKPVNLAGVPVASCADLFALYAVLDRAGDADKLRALRSAA